MSQNYAETTCDWKKRELVLSKKLYLLLFCSHLLTEMEKIMYYTNIKDYEQLVNKSQSNSYIDGSVITIIIGFVIAFTHVCVLLLNS